MENDYLEPILRPLQRLRDPVRFRNTALGFEELFVHTRGKKPMIVSAYDYDEEALRPFIGDIGLGQMQIMGVVNVTPDSFSDGGKHYSSEAAMKEAADMINNGVDILDFGAESTRPRADIVEVEEELRRLKPIFADMTRLPRPISVDTRKADVAYEAIEAGAWMINDISSMEFDPDMAEVLADSECQICLMHAQGTPDHMQDNPSYENEILDIYDYLSDRLEFTKSLGIDPSRIVLDPGIGFGKTLEHNLEILRHVALFHGLGCRLLIGASRKSMIGKISPSSVDQRLAGSLALTLQMAENGVDIIRVHDVFETRQALNVFNALIA